MQTAPGEYLLEYDRLANGWKFPPGAYGSKDRAFAMRFSWMGGATAALPRSTDVRAKSDDDVEARGSTVPPPVVISSSAERVTLANGFVRFSFNLVHPGEKTHASFLFLSFAWKTMIDHDRLRTIVREAQKARRFTQLSMTSAVTSPVAGATAATQRPRAPTLSIGAASCWSAPGWSRTRTSGLSPRPLAAVRRRACG